MDNDVISVGQVRGCGGGFCLGIRGRMMFALTLGLLSGEIPIPEKTRNAYTERTRLHPATVGEGWIVGLWGRQMPIFIRSIETGAMSVGLLAVKRKARASADLAINTIDGDFGIESICAGRNYDIFFLFPRGRGGGGSKNNQGVINK